MPLFIAAKSGMVNLYEIKNNFHLLNHTLLKLHKCIVQIYDLLL